MPAHGKQRDATTRLMKTLERAASVGVAGSAPPPSQVRSRSAFPKVQLEKRRTLGSVVPGGDALAVIERLFRKQKLSHTTESLGDPLGTVRFSGAPEISGVEEVAVELLSAESRLILYLLVVGKPKPAMRREVIEFVTRANAGLVSGNYEYSHDENRVRFKTSLDFRGKKLSFILTENLWLHAFEAHAAYDEALHAVFRGDASAKEAIAACE